MYKTPYPHTISQEMTEAPPNAYALVNGGRTYPDISGIVKFYDTPYKGVILYAEFFHLPLYTPFNIPSFYGFHIHDIGDCSHDFANTGGHYNPNNQLHPYHAGDLPPITSCDGYSWMHVYIQQLRLEDVIGRSIIIHKMADDFTTQPSGNSGEKIACGIVVEWTI